MTVPETGFGRLFRTPYFVAWTMFASFLLGQPVPASDIGGSWIDGQGNEFSIRQSGREITISFADWTYQNDYKPKTSVVTLGSGDITGYIAGVDISATSSDFRLTGKVSSKNIRITVEGAKLPSPLVEVLSRPDPESRLSHKAATKILLVCSHLSAPVGTWIPCRVALADENNSIVRPRGTVVIGLSAAGGHPIPDVVTVGSRHPVATAGLVLDGTGVVAFAALSAQMPGTKVVQYGCRSETVEKLDIEQRYGKRANTGGDGIRFRVLLLGSKGLSGSPGPTYIKLDSDLGVPSAAATPDQIDRTGFIPAGECVVDYNLRSNTSGTSHVRAALPRAESGLEDKAEFYFVTPLVAVTFLWAGLGSLGGAFASGMRNYQNASRWRVKRWAAWLTCGCLGGQGLLLAYYYGLLKQFPDFPAGWGFAFLLGLIGGFLGCEALVRIADLLLPPTSAPKSLKPADAPGA